MTLRLGRGLTGRPFTEKSVLHVLQREIIPVLRDLLQALTSPPVDIEWDAGAASHDVSKATCAVLGALTQNSTLLLTGGFDGAEGTLYAIQDSTGGWTLSITAEDRLAMFEAPAVNTDPDPTPDAVTRYRYRFVTLGGDPTVVFSKVVLQ